jgi:hypothetical protein
VGIYTQFGNSSRDLHSGGGVLGVSPVTRPVPNTMCSPFFPELRADLGPYIVDKTKLIENIVVNRHLRLILFFDVVGNPPCCKCSSNHVGLYPPSVLKLFVPGLFSPSLETVIPNRVCFYIASREDICTEHMGKYPVLFCDFKVRVFFL